MNRLVNLLILFIGFGLKAHGLYYQRMAHGFDNVSPGVIHHHITTELPDF